MNYNEQLKFLKDYRMAGLAFGAVTFVVEGVVYLIGGRPGPWRVALNAALTVALFYAIIYLPKYLHLTIESEKKFFWNVRIRWILISIFLLGGIALAKNRDQYESLFIGALLWIGTNGAVRSWIKSRRGSLSSSHWIGTIYAIVDGLALFLIFDAFSTNVVTQILICGLAAHLAFQLNASLLSIGFLGSINCQSMPEVILFLAIAAASYALTTMAKRRKEQNIEETVTQLTAFTGKNRDEVEQLLATSTGKLAADWNSRRPESRVEVESWYRENSGSYIYDLAQYHLAYKHIVFTLDVMGLARGRVLDYGAGIGDLALALAESGREVTYFDVEGRSKQYARWQAERRKLDLTFASSDEELLGKKFDTIIVLDVLEHLFEPEKALDFLLGRLAEGGTLIVSAYFGATKAHPMHFDHKLDVAGLLASRGLSNAKGISLRLFGSEAMRRHQMLIYHTVV